MAPRLATRISRPQRASVLVTVLIFLAISTTLLVGVQLCVVQHRTLVQREADYAAALDATEAGVNNEILKISANPLAGDRAASPGTGATGLGTFSVYCVDRGTGGDWTAPAPLYIISTGTVHGISRTVRVSVAAQPPDYTVYVLTIGATALSGLTVNGKLGTNGRLSFLIGHPVIRDGIFFNGPNAGWVLIDPGGYTVTHYPDPVKLPTVDEIANRMYPTGGSGINYFLSNNDNARANPPIPGDSIVNKTTTLYGPGDYYLTNLVLSGNEELTLDNRAGPINVWFGPDAGIGTALIRNARALVAPSTDPSKAVHFYIGSLNGITLVGDGILGRGRIDAHIYAYVKTILNLDMGLVTITGSPTINGNIVANELACALNPTINHVPEPYHYAFDGEWAEIGGI